MDVWSLGMNYAEITVDPSEIRLIMKALDVLRYSEESRIMNGSQLINLAGLSHEWLTLTQQVARHECYKHEPVLYARAEVAK